MPENYAAKSMEEIDQLLKDLGAKIGGFNQGKFRKDVGMKSGTIHETSSRRTKCLSLGGGYCAGVCLDWARRVLLSGPNRDQAFLNYNNDKILKLKGFGAEGRTRSQLQDRAFQNVGRMADAYAIHGRFDWQSDGQGAKHLPAEQWKQEAGNLDQFFDKDRDDASRKQHSRKRFSALVLLHSKRSVYSSPGQWMAQLLSDGLRSGAVSKVAFRQVGQAGGGSGRPCRGRLAAQGQRS
jgi:hypothetical protein